MKKMKLGLLALSTIALAGCGNNNNKLDTITIWAPAEEEQVIKAVLDKHNTANPNDQIKYTFKSVSEADGGTTVAADATVKGRPALFAAADDHLNNLVNKSVTKTIPSAYAPDTSKLAPTALTAASVNGQLKAYPISTDNGYFLFYNKSFFAQESEVATFEGILEKAAKNSKTVLMDVANGYYSASFFMSPQVCGVDSLKWAQGEDKKITYTTNWDNDAGATMAMKTSQLLTTYNGSAAESKKTFLMGDDKVISTEATEGRLVAVVTGTWNTTTLTQAWGEENLGAVKLPTLDGKQLSSFAGTKLYCINGYVSADEQRLAYRVAKLLTNKEAQLVRYELRKAIPCDIDAQKDPRYTEHLTPAISALAAQSNFAAVQATAAEGAYWDIGKAIGQAMFTGGTDAEHQFTTAAQWKEYLTSQLNVLRNPK